MDLKAFVKSTLTQVEAGVKEAGDMFSFSGEDVQFDVAVIVSSEDEKGGSLKIAYILEAGGGKKSISTNQVTSRIQFKVRRRIHDSGVVASPLSSEEDSLDPYT